MWDFLLLLSFPTEVQKTSPFILIAVAWRDLLLIGKFPKMQFRISTKFFEGHAACRSAKNLQLRLIPERNVDGAKIYSLYAYISILKSPCSVYVLCFTMVLPCPVFSR
jgi:hypothetical protein